MKHTFFLAASGAGVGLTSVSLGVVRALDRNGIRVGFCNPITQSIVPEGGRDPSSAFIKAIMKQTPPTSIPIHEADSYVREGHIEDLMERVVEKVAEAARDVDIVVVEGLLPAEGRTFNSRLNRLMASSLNAEVILVTSYGSESPGQFAQRIETLAALFGGIEDPRLIGCILNKVGKAREASPSGVVPIVDEGDGEELSDAQAAEATQAVVEMLQEKVDIFRDGHFKLLGAIPMNHQLQSFRAIDVARHLKAEVIFSGDMGLRRVRSFALCARPISRIYHVFAPGALLIMPSDRDEVIAAAALAAMNGVLLAGLLLTGDCALNPDLRALCRRAFQTGLPVLKVSTGSYQTALDLSRMSTEVPFDDLERMNHVMDFVARNIFIQKLQTLCDLNPTLRMSPAAFRYKLTTLAREANRRIILPEGDEPRTIQAAVACHHRRIARCVLLGNPDEIRRVAASSGITLPAEVEILDARKHRARYVEPLVELRKNKHLTPSGAYEALEDNVVLGTMMLSLGEVDGLVSGAVHSSANTIRPALQLIKTHSRARAVSSIFFMCLPEQVLVYGDCAVNTNPDAETLADIAIQSAESAEQFGITPRVALISYSTGESGRGEDVEKVRRATELAKAMRPDLLIDGPLQYDAAASNEVAATKAPDSPVAGNATVFVFPDLNTGNTTYKAVQRSAHLVSIGPMLQGLRKPVNDLSRGALVDDIIYTIAVTAIQAARADSMSSAAPTP
jgi:phosphate acetyltransferase